MRVLIDISHPAHVHFYRHMRERLLKEGVDVIVVARDKDVTLDLLEAFDIPHLTVGRSGHRGWLGQLGELARRDAFLIRQGMKHEVDLVLTRNPSGVQAARVIGAVGIFDTDDGRSVGIHYHAAAPFAHWITAPDCLPETFGAKERRYPSYKSLAYLHPSVYQPDPAVRELLGIGSTETYSILRLVAHDASHDRAARGINSESARRILDQLEGWMPIFISCEGPLESEFSDRQLRVPPAKIHDVIAGASIVVGDSQTVATEAALLATPAVRINTWVNSSPHITELENRYQLAFSFGPDEIEKPMAKIAQLVEDPGTEELWRLRRDRMLEEKVNLTDWYIELISELLSERR